MKNSEPFYEDKLQITKIPLLLLLICAVITAVLGVQMDYDFGVMGFLLLTFFTVGFVVLLLVRNRWRKALSQQNQKCAECFLPIQDGDGFEMDGKRYCKDCYTQKMTMKRQRGDDRASYPLGEESGGQPQFDKNSFEKQYKQRIAVRLPEDFNELATQRRLLWNLTSFFPSLYDVLQTEQRLRIMEKGQIDRLNGIQDIAYALNAWLNFIPLDSADQWNNHSTDQLTDAYLLLDYYIHISKAEDAVFLCMAQSFVGMALHRSFLLERLCQELRAAISRQANTNNNCQGDSKGSSEGMKRFDKKKNVKTDMETTSSVIDVGQFDRDAFIKDYQYAIRPRIPEKMDDLDTQKRLLANLEQVIPIYIAADREIREMERGSLDWLNGTGRIAYRVNALLGASVMEKIVKEWDGITNEQLIDAFLLLDFYSFCLKPEFCENLKTASAYLGLEIQKRLKEKPVGEESPVVRICGQTIDIDSAAIQRWKENPALPRLLEKEGAMQLTGKEPVITVTEDGVKTREYCLQTENDENFDGKYFLFDLRIGIMGSPALPVLQLDGSISDSPELRKMRSDDIGYRMEGLFLSCGKEAAAQQYEMLRGKDLEIKGLKYVGYTTPSNVRLIGFCPECKKSFTFHGYAYYMAQNDVAYSDDGLDAFVIREQDIDKENWTHEQDGKVFRYYNSFNCPHCGAPYIDYKSYPEMKVFGVSTCVHLGRKPYFADFKK